MVIKNHFESYDNLFDIFDEATTTGVFYSIGNYIKDSTSPKAWDPHAVYWNNFLIEGKENVHEKRIYNLIMLIGDLGGVKEIFI